MKRSTETFSKPSAAAKSFRTEASEMYCSRQPWLPQGQGRHRGRGWCGRIRRRSVLAGVEFAVNEDSHAYAFVDVQEDHIFKVLCAGGFADDGEVGFIFYDDRDLKFFFEVVFQVGVFQIVVGCE